MTNEELVSRVSNTVRSLDKDSHISRRYVLSIARSKATFLIAQKLRDKTLYREDALIKPLNCFPLKRESIIDCGIVEFKRCQSLMKSKEKLPELIYSIFGNSIISVSTADGSEELYPVTLKKYRNLQKREHTKIVDNNYYYVQDGYLYLPNCKYELVDIMLITLETEKLEELSTCKDGDCCGSMWEEEFNCPDKLLEAVIQDTLNEVMTSKGIPVDENPNMDSNQKSQTIA